MTDASQDSAKNGPEGIGGPLILVLLGTCFSPLIILYTMAAGYPQIVKLWAARSRLPTSFFIYIGSEVLMNLVFLLGWCVAIYLLFSGSRHYPKTYIMLLLGTLIYICFDLLIASGIYEVQLTSRNTFSLVWAFVLCAIFVPYMMFSKRVRNTFVK